MAVVEEKTIRELENMPREDYERVLDFIKNLEIERNLKRFNEIKNTAPSMTFEEIDAEIEEYRREKRGQKIIVIDEIVTTIDEFI